METFRLSNVLQQTNKKVQCHAICPPLILRRVPTRHVVLKNCKTFAESQAEKICILHFADQSFINFFGYFVRRLGTFPR